MDTWYCKELGDGAAAFGPTKEIQDAYLAYALAQAKTGNLAFDCGVFSRNDLRANMVTVYFTPTASSLASMLGAVPCAKPSPEERLGLLVGDQRNWEIHFPGHLANFRRG